MTRREAFRQEVSQYGECSLEGLARELEAQKVAMDLIAEDTEVDKRISNPDSMLQENKPGDAEEVLEKTGGLETKADSVEIEKGDLVGIASGNPTNQSGGSFTDRESVLGVLEEESASKRDEGAMESALHSIDFISDQLKSHAIHDGALSVENAPTTDKATEELLLSAPMMTEIPGTLIPRDETAPIMIQPTRKQFPSVVTGHAGQASDNDSTGLEHSYEQNQFKSDDRVQGDGNGENLVEAQLDVSWKENGFACKEEDEDEESDATLGESSDVDDSSEDLSEESSETSSSDEDIMYNGRNVEAGEIRDGLVQSVVQEIGQRKKGKKQQRNEDFDSGSDGENIEEPICTKHKVKVLPQVPPINVKLNPCHNPIPVGVISSVLGTDLVVEGIEGQQALNEGSILWITEKRLPLGLVDEVFGPVKKPYYVVRYNDNNEVPEEAKEGVPVSFVTEFATFVLNDPSLFRKGYDASGENDEELSEAEVDFSDDEKESEFKRAKAKMKRVNQENDHHQEIKHHASTNQDYVSGDKGKRWRGGRGREWDNRCLSQENRGMDLDQDGVLAQGLPPKSRLAESVANPSFGHEFTQDAVPGTSPRKPEVLQQLRSAFNVQQSHARQSYRKTLQRNPIRSQQAHGVAKGNANNEPQPPNSAGLFSHPPDPGLLNGMGLMEVQVAQQFSFSQAPTDVGTAHLQWYAGQRPLVSPTMHSRQMAIGIGVSPALPAGVHLMDSYQGQHLYQRPHFSQFPLDPSTPGLSQVAHGFPISSMEQPQAFLHSMAAGFQPTMHASVFPGPVLGVPASSLNGHSFEPQRQRPPFVQDCGHLAGQFFQPPPVATSLNGHSFELQHQRPPFVQDCGHLAEQFFQPPVANLNLYHGPRMPQRPGATFGMPQQLVHLHRPLITRQPPQSGMQHFQ